MRLDNQTMVVDVNWQGPEAGPYKISRGMQSGYLGDAVQSGNREWLDRLEVGKLLARATATHLWQLTLPKYSTAKNGRSCKNYYKALVVVGNDRAACCCGWYSSKVLRKLQSTDIQYMNIQYMNIQYIQTYSSCDPEIQGMYNERQSPAPE